MASNSTEEWERLWQVVRASPDDFSSWEQLIRLVESAEGGITASSPPENVTNLESVFDGFLEKFPLCFGYWRKYADWELAVHGDAGAEKIYERGVAAISNSIDLWNQYLDFKLANTQSNDEILGLFERASGCVGLDFLGHPFWDKYLEFAESKLANPQLVLQLLDRIVLIPMHQYARYYEKWRGIRQSASKISDVLDAETLEKYTQEIFEEKGKDIEDIEPLLKEKMDAYTAEVYKNTQEGTNKRWVYEAEIKRSYFHVKPLDRPQLQNWNKYLDFEESLNQPERIRALYERCLVPCAQYEDYWLRYGHWLIKNNMVTDARKAYERAAYLFLPRERTSIRIALGLVLEEEGQIEEARKIYTTVLETTPTHVETILNYLHFERRQNPLAFKDLCLTYTQAAHLTKSATAFFTVQLTRFLQLNGDIDQAREIFETQTPKYIDNKFFWINYINFEMGFYGEQADARISAAFEKAREHLPFNAKKEITTRYREYLLERGQTVNLLNRVPSTTISEISSLLEPPAGETMKRAAPEDNSANYHYSKQARFDNPQQPYQQPAYGFQQQPFGNEYYQQQQQQQQQPGNWQP